MSTAPVVSSNSAQPFNIVGALKQYWWVIVILIIAYLYYKNTYQNKPKKN
jgi:hypothetical protein